MLTVKSLTKSMAFCAVVALSQLSAIHAMDSEIATTHRAPALRMTFTAEDVVAHAATLPENYDMEYLNTEAGKKEIQNYIVRYNNGEFTRPTTIGDLAKSGKFSGLNTSNPNAGYNKSTIAHVITDDRIREGKFKFSSRKTTNQGDELSSM